MSVQGDAGTWCRVGKTDRCTYCGGDLPLPLETEGACTFELPKEVVAALDVNGDGQMAWSEFTAFVVDSGMAGNDENASSIQQWHARSWVKSAWEWASAELLHLLMVEQQLTLVLSRLYLLLLQINHL